MKPAMLTADTEAEFAALTQAMASGVPFQAPIEVLRAFAVSESAEAEDIQGRPWLDLVSGG